MKRMKAIITTLFAIVALAGQAKDIVWEQPTKMKD